MSSPQRYGLVKPLWIETTLDEALGYFGLLDCEVLSPTNALLHPECDVYLAVVVKDSCASSGWKARKIVHWLQAVRVTDASSGKETFSVLNFRCSLGLAALQAWQHIFLQDAARLKDAHKLGGLTLKVHLR